MLLTNVLSTELNIPQNSDFPRYSDFFPADGRSHYIEVLLYKDQFPSILTLLPVSIRPFARDLWSKDPIHGNSLKKLLNHLSIMKVWYNKYDVIEVEEFNSFISKEFKLCSLQFCNRCIFPIDNRKKEVSTKLWYSMIGHLATRWLSPFLGVARLCAYAHMIFTAVSKREAVS